MTRNLNWIPSLFDYMAEVWDTPFEWGVFDCFLFVGGAVKAMTGASFVDEVRGKYTDMDSALELCKIHGYQSPLDFLARNFERNESILSSSRGDIMVVKEDGELLLGICQGERIYLAGPTGIVTTTLDNAKRSYRV